MTRISENQMVNGMITAIQNNRRSLNNYGNQATNGLKVAEPGDSMFSGTISELQTTVSRLSGYASRISKIQGYFSIQDDILDSANNLLTRAKELATQAANESNGSDERKSIGAEVAQLRDQLYSLACSQYQGIYLYSGTATDTPAYAEGASFAEGGELSKIHYEYSGNQGVRTVKITDSLSLTMNTAGNKTFGTALTALEKLTRALDGYRTVTDADNNIDPSDPGNTAYDFPADYNEQTEDITACIDLLKIASEKDIGVQRVDVASRLNRILAAESLIGLQKTSADESISKLQDADIVEVASNYAITQQALQASMTVTSRMLSISILDYI